MSGRVNHIRRCVRQNSSFCQTAPPPGRALRQRGEILVQGELRIAQEIRVALANGVVGKHGRVTRIILRPDRSVRAGGNGPRRRELDKLLVIRRQTLCRVERQRRRPQRFNLRRVLSRRYRHCRDVQVELLQQGLTWPGLRRAGRGEEVAALPDIVVHVFEFLCAERPRGAMEISIAALRSRAAEISGATKGR